MSRTAEIITSAQNPAIKAIRALEFKKNRQEAGLFAAEGRRALERARQAGIAADTVVSVEPPGDWGQARTLKVSEAVMARLSQQNNPTGLIGVFRQSAILSDFAPASGDVAVSLEDIRDPGNLGTIIRTADAVSARHIVLVGETCDPFSPDAVRATMGSLFGVRLCRMTAKQFQSRLAEWPGEIVATAAEARTDYRRTYARPTLLLMGSEGRGLSDALAAQANVSVRIPMSGGAESLNVAIAAALMLYEIKRPEL
ncbi:MAG: TrmH family RNA methyltransferase [Parvibaculaceae bacterium]